MSTRELAIAVVNEQEARHGAREYERRQQEKACDDAICVLLCTCTLVASFVMIFVSMAIMTDLRLNSDYCVATGLPPVAVQRLDTGLWYTHYRHQLTARSGFNCTMENSSEDVRQGTFRCSSSQDTRQCDDVEADILGWTIAFGVLGGLWLGAGLVACLVHLVRRRQNRTPTKTPENGPELEGRAKNACSV